MTFGTGRHQAVWLQFEREIISERTHDKMSPARRKRKRIGVSRDV